MPSATTPTEPLDSIAMLIDGELWCYMQAPELFLRLRPGSLASSLLHDAEGHTQRLLRMAAENAKGPALPVARGVQTTIGGITVDAALLDAVESTGGELTWRPWQRWLAGFSEDGRLTALWRLPDGAGLLDLFIVEALGHLWAVNPHFACRFVAPTEAIPRLRESMNTHPPTVAALLAALDKGRTGRLASVARSKDVVHIGETRVPRDQFDAVIALSREAALEWRFTGALDPVVGFKHGEPVALIAPLSSDASARSPAAASN